MGYQRTSKISRSAVSALATLIVSFCFSSAGHAQSNSLFDSKFRYIGAVVKRNTVLIRSGSLNIEMPFKSPGFNAVNENLQFVTFYYESTDCSGSPFYSDQADGRWTPNNTPSIFDVPAQGIVVGLVVSPVDRNYFSQVDVYVPTPPLISKSFRSIREIGLVSGTGDCKKTSGEGQFVALSKLTTAAFSPPFRMISGTPLAR